MNSTSVIELTPQLTFNFSKVLTVIIASLANTSGQTPDLITALYFVLCVSFDGENVFDVFVISDHEVKGEMLNCHLLI